MHILVWTLEEQEYALELSSVEQALLTVEILPLPGCPQEILGAINLHGEMVPLFNIRHRLRLKEREMDENNHIVVCKTPQGRLAFLVDRVLRVTLCHPEQVVTLEQPLAASNLVRSVLKLEGETVILLDLAQLTQEKACLV